METDDLDRYRRCAAEQDEAHKRWFPFGYAISDEAIRRAEGGFYEECNRIREKYFGKQLQRKKGKR